MDTGTLEQVGLSKNETKVYFALLELGQDSANPIIKKSGIPNSKLYSTIEKLIKKGLASYVIKNNVKYFQASDPKNLIELLNTKEKQIVQQKERIKEILPQIETRRKLGKEKQEATVYESMSGIKVALNYLLETLNPGDEYYVFTLGEELAEENAINFFRNYHHERTMKKIKVKLLGPEKIRAVVNTHHEYSDSEVRFTEKELPIGTFVFKNHIMILVWGETPTAFLIKSKTIFEHYTKLFDSFWKQAKK